MGSNAKGSYGVKRSWVVMAPFEVVLLCYVLVVVDDGRKWQIEGWMVGWYCLFVARVEWL